MTKTTARAKANCETGKSCKSVCIPKNHECHQNGGGASIHLSKEGKASGWVMARGKAASGSADLTDAKVILGGVALTIGGVIASKVIREKIEDVHTFRQFADDVKFWKKTEVPNNLKSAYTQENKDLQTALLASEQRVKDKPYETLFIFDKKGKPIVIRGGESGSAGLGITDLFKLNKIQTPGNTVTHNHPHGGATFSPTDISTAGEMKLAEIRATTANEIYTLKPKSTKTFDPKKTAALVANYEPKLQRRLNKALKQIAVEDLNFKANPKGATGNLLYYSTIGQGTFNTKLGRKVEFDVHKDLANIIDTKFKDDFIYSRVPRYETKNRENKFNTRSDSYPLSLYQITKDAISEIYGDIDGFPSIKIDELGSITGIFRDSFQIYDYAIAPNGVLSYVESTRSDSYLVGFSVDSGYSKRYDTAITKKPKKCLQGKPCKNTCIAKGVTCRVQLSPQNTVKVRRVIEAASIKVPPVPQEIGGLPIGKAALALTATAAFTVGSAYMASQLKDGDTEGATHALVSVYQDALEKSGARTFGPVIATKLEKFMAYKDNPKKVDRQIAKALSGSIFTAHADAEKEKANPAIVEQLKSKGRATAKERLEYIGDLTNEPIRASDFKFSLGLFGNRRKMPPYPEELAALRYYTDTRGYQEMNGVARGKLTETKEWLVKNHKDKRSLKQIESDGLRDTNMVTSALNALPNYRGTVYRGLTLPESVIPKKGQVWNEKGFTSTTKNIITRYPGNVVVVIKSKSGKDITPYEKYKNDEVLFKPNTSFEVTTRRKVKKFGKEFWLVKMRQVD